MRKMPQLNEGLVLVGLLAASQAVFGIKMLEAKADQDTLRSHTQSGVEAVLNPNSLSAIIKPAKVAVRSAPQKSNNVVFYLYQGMQVNFEQTVVKNGETWARFDIEGRHFWINLTENENAREKAETPRGYKIVIEKAARILTVLHGNGSAWEIKGQFPVGLGGHAAIDMSPKTKEWDGLTPEGVYYVSWKNPASFFGRNSKGKALGSLYISYPNTNDAWKALLRGDISLAVYRQVALAVQKKQTPPKNTGMGNEVMIHGGGASDWTAGCIALDNAAMEWLWKTMPHGTSIEIKP